MGALRLAVIRGGIPTSAAPDEKEKGMQTLNQGNNEQISRGIVQTEGGFLALTFTQSKEFKTYSGALKWLTKRGVTVK